MSEKINIRYRYEGIEAWEKSNEDVRKFIKEDSGQDFWPETRSLPPFGMPPPVSKDCVEKLKALDGVVVDVVED
ncbi:succinyl- :3-ketoacid-coenzyme a mitochondrial precursor [Fusarium longipes]|uniref:Succinyl-:3-ketoacid-coenzyme a mitochondrial n=1 Tax=Fusarium longipes TaxID=694270 RepID=A0A395T5L6_9HYPO|nr:succinyl- :3-ketoacid-coenzyme a mitochondrial precursor [Fusarium longipes]